MNDKHIEIKRYDDRARKILVEKIIIKKIPQYINVPYQYYFSLIKKLKKISY